LPGQVVGVGPAHRRLGRQLRDDRAGAHGLPPVVQRGHIRLMSDLTTPPSGGAEAVPPPLRPPPRMGVLPPWPTPGGAFGRERWAGIGSSRQVLAFAQAQQERTTRFLGALPVARAPGPAHAAVPYRAVEMPLASSGPTGGAEEATAAAPPRGEAPWPP